MSQEQPYTVCGLWVDSSPVVAAVFAGHLQAQDDPGYTECERWCAHVTATDPEHAEVRAVENTEASV